ncbi:hypothetical protein AK812_SmicGene31323 [Symbiodinium microadriaticum]|uniref:Uncharacterized protein n=1 Tax=Symbiodinium microadriaticum TaxID=2951 RepID=A0A1Q9CWZ4_SYMMI|nr:hypothetical protein AK812_SmicGene31323 [Symbiodinium microadriaticum]
MARHSRLKCKGTEQENVEKTFLENNHLKGADENVEPGHAHFVPAAVLSMGQSETVILISTKTKHFASISHRKYFSDCHVLAQDGREVKESNSKVEM